MTGSKAPGAEAPRYSRRAADVIDAEWRHLRRHRPHLAAAAPDTATWPLVGLALSGGGIRSAAFALGALHALNRFDLLRHVDYLSTVSGGGYCGTALTWTLSTHDKSNLAPQLSRADDSQPLDGFPLAGWRQGVHGTYSADPPDPEAFPSRRLDSIRRRGNYLTPGHLPGEEREGAASRDRSEDGRHLSLLSALAVVMRGSLLAIVVYGTFVAVAMVLIRGVAEFAVARGLFDALLAWLPIANAVPTPRDVAWTALFLTLAAIPLLGLLAAFVPGAAAIFNQHWRGSGSEHRRRARYQWRLGKLLFYTLACLLLASLPMAPQWLTALALGGGTAAGVLRFAGKNVLMPGLRALPTTTVVGIGGALLSYGLLVLVYAGTGPFEAGPAVLVAALAAGVIGRYSRTNYLTPHRMYRDRLMEAFMPAPVLRHVRPCWGHGENMAMAGDRLLSPDRRMLAHMCGNHPDWDPAADGLYPGPYHLINANIVLTGSRDDSLRGRGGDNFVLSPLYCGCNATGWRRTDDYALPPRGDTGIGRPVITLATAMAVSGAAVNPNGWAGDEGPTRNRFVAFLMTILNLRLGYDIPNPRPERFESASRVQPNLLSPGSARLFGAHADESSSFVEISDGGHFENLGLYELFRRECKLIICSDAGADPAFAFADLTRSLERARVDFGVNVKFLKAAHLRDVIPPRDPAGNAVGTGFAERGFAIARIEYPASHRNHHNEPVGPPRHGLLVYLKSTLLADLPVDLLGYRASNAAFPHQATVDQFFTEAQFEAYRELGYQLTKRCIQSRQLRDVFAALAGRRERFETAVDILAEGET